MSGRSTRETGVLFRLALAAALAACAPLAAPQPTATLRPESAPLEARAPAIAAAATAAPTLAPEPLPIPTATPSASPTPSAIGPQFPAGIDPLTGQRVADPALLDRRPMAVKVSNFPRSLRPQTGLGSADLVWEYYTEEGMTRFIAFFLGKDTPRVGPVRSARLVDAQLVNLYSAVLAFVGADPLVLAQVVGSLGARAISEKPSTCPAICRAGNGNVNSVFADTAAMTQFARARGEQPLGGMVFSSAPPAGGVPGTGVHVQFSWGNRAEWRFSPERQAYQRWSEDEKDGQIVMVPLTDRADGTQIQAANVLVVYAWYSRGSGNEKYNIEFVYRKRGRVQLFRDGQLYEGFWLVKSPQRPLEFVDPEGNPLPLRPGNSWLEVVGEYSQSSQPNPGAWNVLFRFP